MLLRSAAGVAGGRWEYLGHGGAVHVDRHGAVPHGGVGVLRVVVGVEDAGADRGYVAQKHPDGRITLEADPGAEPFYLAMGAHRIGSVPSGSIPCRFIPLLEVPIAGVEAR